MDRACSGGKEKTDTRSSKTPYVSACGQYSTSLDKTDTRSSKSYGASVSTVNMSSKPPPRRQPAYSLVFDKPLNRCLY